MHYLRYRTIASLYPVARDSVSNINFYMNKVISMQKSVVFTLIVALLAWTVGAALMAFVPTAQAAVADGTLVKTADRSAVYYVNNGMRYVYPDQKTYDSWHADFSGVQTISQSELENYLIGGNVTYRAGTYMIKITSDSKTYAVEPGGVLRWVTTEQIAKDLYGDDWNTKIRDVSDAFFVNYTMGSDITSSTYPTGALVKMADDSTIYYIDGSSKRAFADQAAFDANGFQMKHVLTTSMDLSSYSNGSDITGAESELTTVAGPGSSAPVSSGSGLTLALASDVPASAVLPQGAAQVGVLNFNVTASSDGAVTLNGVTIKRTGAGNETDFSNVYLYDGATRLTTGRSINDNSQSASFNSLDLTIPAGTTKKLSVLVDVASGASAGSVHVFSVESASAVSASGTVSGSFPISGNVMTIASVPAGTVTIAKNGSIANPKVGEKDVKLAEFKLSAGSSEDITFKRISLFYAGSVSREDITNFELRQSGDVLATASGINNDDLVVLDLGSNALDIQKGQSKVFEVYADVSGEAKSGSGEEIKFYLDEDGDLLAVGKVYGFGVSVTRDDYDGGSCTSSSGDCSYSSVDAGQVTITSNGPSARDISRNADDVVLLEFTIASQVEAEFRQFVIRLDGGTGTADLKYDTDSEPNVTDVKVIRKSDGAVVAGPSDLSGSGSDTSQTLTFTDRFIQEAGVSSDYQITADIASTMTDDSKLRASIVEFGDSDIKNLDNNTFIGSGDIVPSSDILGNTMTVLTPALELGLASVPVSDTYIKGTNDVAITAFTFTAGDADDIEITTINLTGYIDDTGGSTFVKGSDSNNNNVDVQDILTTVWLVDSDGNQIGDRESFTSGGVATFSNFTWIVPAGMTETLTVRADISSNAYQDSNPEALSVDLASASDVTARDSDGNSVTATGAGPNGTTSPTVVATVTNAGTITVASGPIDSSVEAQLLVGGSMKQPLANLRFSASNESLELTQLQLRVPTTTTDEVTMLYLYDGSTQLGNGVSVNSSGVAKFTFTAGNGFQIDKDDSKTLTVKGDLNTSSLGADSGATVSVDLMYDTNFEARGIGQSDTLITSVGSSDVSSQNHYIYKTVPTVSTVSLGSSTLLNGAENDIYSFKVSADAAEDVSLKQIKFSITSSTSGANTIDISTFRFFRGSNDISDNVSIVDGSGQSLESGGDSLQEGATSAYVIFSTEELITAGSSTTFTLRATLSGFTEGADYINTKIADDSTSEEGHKYLDTTSAGLINLTDSTGSGTETAAQAFIWSDNSASPHYSNTSGSSRSADWFNGYLVENLPTSSLTVSVPN